jgi:hypothetical protein
MGGAPKGPSGVAVVVFTQLLHDGIPRRVLTSTKVGSWVRCRRGLGERVVSVGLIDGGRMLE